MKPPKPEPKRKPVHPFVTFVFIVIGLTAIVGDHLAGRQTVWFWWGVVFVAAGALSITPVGTRMLGDKGKS